MLTAKAQTSLDFAHLLVTFNGAGPFGPLGRPKDMIERLEQNKSEQSRLMTAVKYNSKQKRVHSKFLLSL